MSQHLHSLREGQELSVWGPRGKIRYMGNGTFKIREEKESGDFNEIKTFKHIGMVCGGTGLAPMLQVIRSVLSDQNDTTKITMIFANRTEEDILCREELDQLASDDRLTVVYCLSKPVSEWTGESGYINGEMISKHFPAPSEDFYVLLCGSPKMVNEAYLPGLSGYQTFTY